MAKVMDGEAIIMNLTSGVYYSSDGVGGVIWEALQQGVSLGDTLTVLAARYDVDPAKAEADLHRFVGELESENLIRLDGTTPSTSSPPREERASKQSYREPELHIYSDMGDLLALDPPAPDLYDAS
ncbi:MAG: PqqD family peptide modification chaperone [Armatimonadetes bacterium]|nr:PqqD family peptide modification chaperone [Armatimonadota bacterium]